MHTDAWLQQRYGVPRLGTLSHYSRDCACQDSMLQGRLTAEPIELVDPAKADLEASAFVVRASILKEHCSSPEYANPTHPPLLRRVHSVAELHYQNLHRNLHRAIEVSKLLSMMVGTGGKPDCELHT